MQKKASKEKPKIPPAKVWVRKGNPRQVAGSQKDFAFIYQPHVEEQRWLERSAIAISHGFQSAEAIQEFLNANGLSMIKAITMGAKEVLLEFQNKEEMEEVLSEARDLLLAKFLC